MGLTLPEDALAEILRRLPARSLATSRCVCQAWRAIVDSRRLLLPELLPQSVRGIFIMCRDIDYPLFLSHPSTDPEMLGKLDFYRDPGSCAWSTASVLGNCNGLLLYRDTRGLHVANPATQRRAHLPPPPRFWGLFGHDAHLVFDPTESPHYEVFLVPQNWFREDHDMQRREQLMDEQWPPSTWVLCVFSSRTGKWEERAFVREGEAAGMASDKALQWRYSQPVCSAYWDGDLFAQCTEFAVMRISLSNNKHKVIKLPTGIEKFGKVCLGRSKEELCCATFICQKLRVWILDDSCGATGWRLKHHANIQYTTSHVMWFIENEGPWKLQDVSNSEDNGLPNLQDVNNNEDNAPVRSKIEWDSDNDNIIDLESDDGVTFLGQGNSVLGFHPYKDVIFLNFVLERAVAYHLNTSVVQDLGKVRPDDYCGTAAELLSSFLYTPCLMVEFPENKLEAHVEG